MYQVDRPTTDANPQVAQAVRAIEAARAGKVAMLSQIEKVIMLKTVGRCARLRGQVRDFSAARSAAARATATLAAAGTR